MEATTALPVPIPVQFPTAQAALTPPAVPALAIQAAPPPPTASHTPADPIPSAPPAQAAVPSTKTTVAAQPAQSVLVALATKPPVLVTPAAQMTSPKTAPPVAHATTPTVADPAKSVTDNTTVGHTAPTPEPIDTEAETTLTAEITRLWADHKQSKTTIRQTREEAKALRLELGAKLSSMKNVLVRTGRGGGWASYLRAQHLPLSSADRLVAEHEATLAPPAKKVPSEEVSTATIEEVQAMARKMAGKLNDILTSQELLYAYAHEFVWNLDVAEAWYTDAGFEIPKTGSDDAPEDDAPVAELANPAPAVP